MTQRTSHWTHAGLTFLLTILAAGILLPLVRVEPEAVHNYFRGLRDWLRVSFVFVLSVAFTAVVFKLLSPRVRHATRWKSQPPAWLAALLAWLVVAAIDISAGFDVDGYRANIWEWLGYGGGALLIVGWYYGLWSEVARGIRKPRTATLGKTEMTTLEDIKKAPWEEIQAWLQCDTPARYDFLDNRKVADRVSHLLSRGTRSVGIVGPFGAGKTSIVTWVIDHLENRLNRSTKQR